MKLRKRKTVLILICLFNLFQALESETESKNNLRKTWEEVVKYDKSGRDSEERESLEKCEDSDYKYFIHFVSGNDVTFEKYINYDNAVSYFSLFLF